MHHNQNSDRPPANQNMQRNNNGYSQNDGYNSYPVKQKRPGMTNYYICQGIRIAFIIIFIIECYYCYMWLIQPLMPIIKNIIANNGVPSMGISIPKDVAHPLNGIHVAGMSGESILSLGMATAIRLGIFGIAFPVTIKLRNIMIGMFA